MSIDRQPRYRKRSRPQSLKNNSWVINDGNIVTITVESEHGADILVCGFYDAFGMFFDLATLRHSDAR